MALWVVLCGRLSAQPLISLQPQAILNLLLGSSASFQVGASSAVTTNLQYQWFRNGVRIPGETNNSLTINNAQATDGGAFTVRVNDGVGVVESETAGLTVNILNLVGDTLLNLLSLTNGQIRSANTGDINVLGDPDIVPGDPGGSTAWYYWTPLLSGVATFTTEGSDFDTVMGVYTGSAPSHLTAVPTAINNDDGGGYLSSRVTFKASALTTYVIGVDGYYGAQGNVVLTWGVALGDTLPTAAATIASATAPPTNEVQLSSPWPGHNCDWLLGNVVVASNTNSLTITNLNDSTVGAYTARFTTANGSIAYARPTSIQVNTIQDGTTVTNSFAWNKFLDSANSVYAPTGTPQKMAAGGDTRGYSVSQIYSTKGNSDEPGEPIVCNQDGGSPSWYTYVTPSSGSLVINTAGSSFNTVLGVFVGSGNSFSTLTNIGCGYTTNYAADGQPIVTIPNVPAHQTNYIVVEGENGASGTVHLNIKLGAPVAINSAPTNQCAGPGTNVTLAVSATGATPLSFAWQFNGTNIPGATNAILTLNNVDTSLAGPYTIVVSNQISVATAQAMLSVVEPPSILNEPSNQTCCVGSIAAFNCVVGGDDPLTYQWQYAGTNLVSATNSSLTLSNVQMSDSGAYSCLVSNLTGVATTSAATLTVNPANPTVTWSNPAAFGYGSVLTYSQLNATASVPGTFAYSPPTGTILTVGTQTLSAVFTPTDNINYSTVTNKVVIVVSPAPLTVTAVGRSKTYGQGVTFSGSEFTTTGLVNGDSVTGVTLASSGSAAAATVSGSPYTIMPSAAVGSGLGNYSISYVNSALTVNPAPLTITANNRTKSYGRIVTFAGTEFAASGLANGDTVASVTLASTGAATTAVAGSPYNIIPSAAVGIGLGNYTIAYGNGMLSVTPAILTITANNRTKTYGQSASFAGTEFTAVGLVNGDTVSSVSLISSGAASTATVAGSPYNIFLSTAVGIGLGNYTIAYANGTMSVTPATLTITANNRTKSYGQAVTFAGSEFTATGLANGDSVSSVILVSSGAVASATVVGSPYSIVSSAAIGTGLGNYTIAYANGMLSLNPTTLMITANNRSKSYGQAVTFAGTEFTANGLFNGDAVSGVTLTSAGAAANANVTGLPYSIIPSGAVGSGLANYTISYTSGAFTVSPATLTITANNRTKTYGQTVAFTGTEFTASGLLNGDTATSVTLTSIGGTSTASVAGSPYAVVPTAASGTGLGNYSIIYSGGTLKVAPAALSVTAVNRSKTYGKTVTFTGNEFTTSGLVNSDTVNSVTLSSAGAAATATVSGSPYAVAPNSPVGAGLDNYTITFANGTLTVNPAAITITANNRSKTFGQSVTFAGNEFTTTGLLNGDSVNGVTLSSAGATATATVVGSPYPIVPNAALGTGLANYTLTYANGVLTVGAAASTVTWPNPASIVYGTPLSGTQLNASASVPGSFAYTPTNGTVLSAGVNALSVVFTPSDASDYASVTNSSSLLVLPAALKVMAQSASRIYGQANPKFTGIVSGVTNGDTITASYATTATTNSPFGNYDIVPSLVDLNNRQTNYVVNLINGTLTVTPALPTVTWTNPPPITYGAALSAMQLNASASVPGAFIYSPPVGSVLDAGTNWLSVVFTPTDVTDYKNVNTTVPVVVLPAPLTITASNVSRPFATENPIFCGSIVGLTNGDDISASYSSTATIASTVGTYPIVPSLIDPNNRLTNYVVNLVNGILVVGHPSQVFTWTNPAPMIYGAPLTSAQLNALANIPGNYSYSPSNGTVLNTGTNTLSVIFAPADPVDYSAVTDFVAVIVVPAPLTVTAPTIERYYGQSNPVFAGFLNGVTNNDVVTETYNCSATEASGVGAYSIIPDILSMSYLTNYAISYVNGMMKVDPAPLTITANTSAKTYGQSMAFTGTEFTTSGLVNGDMVTSATLNSIGAVSSTTVEGSPYGIALSGAVGSGLENYNITYVNGSLTVNPAVLNIAAKNLSKTYGQTFIFAGTEFVATGLVNGDSITSVTLTSPGSVATASVLGSPYTIIPTAASGIGLANYSINYANGVLVVSGATPILSWVTPDPFTYGTALNSNQLNATANVEGAFFYTPTNGSFLNSGTNTLSVIFTPSDTADYATVTNSVNLVVSPAPLTITAASASRIYGQENPQFIGAITGLTNDDNITADYICNTTNTSTVGTYPIMPSLVDPANRQTNYTVSLVNGALTITQAIPVVNWNDPAPIFSGTPLTAGDLNATANVPGSFTYAPSLGTSLYAGTNTLSVVFTPDDTTNYATATDAVGLVVVAPQTIQTVQTTLQTSVQNGVFVLSWPTNAANATLEMTTDLLAEWMPVTNSVVDGDHFVVTVNMTGVAAFFRLKP